MGYCITILNSKFKVNDPDAALAAIKQLMTRTDLMRGGSYQGGQKTQSWFSWVNTEQVLVAKTIEEALLAWGYELADDGGIDFLCEKLGQEELMFQAIAPYVEAGSFIEVEGEDNERWRWYFDGVNCIYQKGRMVYEQ